MFVKGQREGSFTLSGVQKMRCFVVIVRFGFLSDTRGYADMKDRLLLVSQFIKWTLLTNQILKKNKPGIILQSFLLATTPIKRLPPKSYRCEEKSDADLLVVFMKSHIHPEGGMNVRTVTATHWDISHRTREELKKPHHTFHTRGVLSNWRSLFEHVHEQKRFKVERLLWIIHGL